MSGERDWASELLAGDATQTYAPVTPATGYQAVYDLGSIDIRARRPARGTAPRRPLADLVLVPFWDDSDRGAEWETVQINEYVWPGLAKVGGTGPSMKLDAKSRSGSDGARLVRKGYEPAAFDVTLILWTAEHLDALGEILPLLRPGRATTARRAQDSESIDLYHPSLAMLGITQGVVKSISVLAPGSVKGSWEQRISFVEYREPTPRPARATSPRGATSLSTVQTAFPAAPSNVAGSGTRPSAQANP